MENVIQFIFLFLIGSTLVSFGIALLARMNTGHKEFDKLILYWSALFVNFAAVAVLSKNPVQIALAYYFQFIPSYILTKTLRDARGIKTSLIFFGTIQIIGMSATTILLLFTNAGFTLSLIPITISTSLTFWEPVWNTLVTHRKEANWIEKGMGFVLLTSIVNHFNYAFFRLEESAAWWGWGVSIAQYQCLSIFMPLLISHRRGVNERKNVLTALEKISGQNSNINVELDELYSQLELQIAQREQFSQRLQVSNAHLQEEREMNEMLIRTVSHDIANPLQAINAYVELFCAGKISEQDREKILQRMKNSLKASLDMISRIRNAILTRSEAELLALSEVSIDHAIHRLLDQFELSINEKNLTINFNNSCGPNINVIAEENALCEHVLSNILSNAIKFSFENAFIDINVEDSGEFINIVFKDTGTGIEKPRLKKRILESTQGTNGESGSGFGIMVMGYFLRKFGGSFTISSETAGLNRGTRIALKLKKASYQFKSSTPIEQFSSLQQ